MHLTRHTDYALRVLIYLATQNKRVVTIADISDYYSISRNHLIKIVQELNRHGFVITIRGKHGGVQLGQDVNDISIGEVIRKMESNFDIVECFDKTEGACKIDMTCYLKNIFHGLVNNFLKELDGVSLAEVIKPNLH